MGNSDLCYLPAATALAAFKAKTLSPVELMDAVIERAEAVEEHINAFTYTYFDQARDAAKRAEAKYAAGEETGALEGLPIGIKDESYIEGLPTSNGSLLLKDFIAPSTSPVNERILAAGGIVHARTATPEFSCAAYTWSRLWGVTRNPWNLACTPGGSSGGSAASLAAGTSSLCTGSDIAGSIRIPAGTCGLVGYKPPYGRNPEEPPFNLDFYAHAGPLARTVADTILFQNVMCGPHPLDVASLRPKLELPTEYPPIEGWKIAFSPTLGYFEVDPEVEANTRAALDVFRSLGATVEEVDLKWDSRVFDAGMAHLRHLFAGFLAREMAGRANDMTNYAREFAESSVASTAEEFVSALEVGGRMYDTLGPLLEDFNLLICPTNALPAVPADFDHARDSLAINGHAVDPMLGWVMTTPFNTLSRCPVLSVPSGHAANGVPTAIQIVGRTYCDGDVFQAASAYEKEIGGWYAADDHRPALP